MTARLKALYGDDVEVDFCMRYGNPSTESVLTRLKEKGCERIVFFRFTLSTVHRPRPRRMIRHFAP
ncbi:hypothetical protein HORIV_45640 [Vreelandella olivaria]|uniref:Uncharacterized protein n=1 Tax=Vreelandella olivaria TaxID=390919 RepID=A0ABM7GNB1_9GAMM|nr:hypothetical protein HORIV_45640 [Halomonas olivaria]